MQRRHGMNRWLVVGGLLIGGLACILGPEAAFAQDLEGSISNAATNMFNILGAASALIAGACVFYWLILFGSFFAQGFFPGWWMTLERNMRMGMLMSVGLFLVFGSFFAYAEGFIGGFTGG